MSEGNIIDETRRVLTPKDKEFVSDLFAGKRQWGSDRTQAYINKKPHVGIAIEAILDKQGLTDVKLTKRLKDIITRKATESINPKTGTASTNIASIDANALNTVRTIFQLKGKFVEKHEVGGVGDFTQIPDADLDKIIENGIGFLGLKKDQINHG